MLARLSVRKPYTVLVGVVLILVLGFMSFRDMSTDLFPSMELPYALVMTTYPGASPEEVEKAVSVPVEQAMARINGVEEMQSMSVNNMSIVYMQFAEGTDMASATVDMRENLDMTTAQWDDAIGNPTIMKLNPDMMPIMVAALDYDNVDKTEIGKKIRDNVLPELESVEGVASVNASGDVEKKVQVIIQKDKIDKMNKKIRDAIDGKLEKAEKKLYKGEKKLKDGKQTLQDKSKEAAKQMGSGQTKLTSASIKLANGLNEIDKQLTEVKKQRKTLASTQKKLKSGLATMTASKTKLNSTVKTLTATKTSLNTAKSGLDSINSQIDKKKAELDAQPDNADIKAEYDALVTQKGVIVSKLKGQGITEETLLAKIKEVETGLTTASTGLTTITTQEKTLKTNLKKVNSGITKVDAGIKKMEKLRKKMKNGSVSTEDASTTLNQQQILASIQMGVAEAKINSGADKISDAKKQMKEAKKTTKENSDLNKILTKEMVENILKGENFDMPSGYITEDDASYLVRVGNKIQSEKDVRDLVVVDMDLDGLDPIKLSDVADVAVTDNSEDVYTVVNGNPAMAVTIQKQSGFSTGDVTKKLKAKLEALEKEEEGLNTSIVMDQGVYIDLVVDSVLENLLLGGILAILILLLFLMDLRPTFIVACSIPLSVVAAVVCMYFSGVSLNIISLSGLALGVGMLVDNSVVVIENIFRLRQEGRSIRKAAVEGAKGVAGAILASTLTTVCVFTPIIFTSGITKELFVDLALTIAYTLGASLVVALTLVPAMASGMMKKSKGKEPRFVTALQKIYRKTLTVVLRFRAVTLIASFVLLVLFAVLAVNNGFSMMPEMESTQLMITLTTEDDKDFGETKVISDEAIKKIKEISDVESVCAYAGGANTMSMLTGGGSGDENAISMYVLLNEERKLDNDEITKAIEEKTKDLECELDINASAMDMSALMGSGVSIDVKGKDLDKLRSISEDLVKELEKVKGLKEVSNGLEDSGNEYRVSVDKAKAMKYSLTVAQVYQFIYAKVKEESSSSTISTDTDELGIYVSNSEDNNLTRKDIKKMKINYTDPMTQKTKKVRLSKIATFKDAALPNTIVRKAQVRTVTVTAKFEDGVIVSDVSKDVEKVVNSYDMPDGYTTEMDGENEATMEAMGDVLLMLVLGILVMYLIMVAQFQSLLSPFIIMFTIPLAFTGGFMGLWISGSDVSVIALIGFVMLSGIIVNNGIVLVDYINQLRREGMEKKEAIVKGGVTRIRPILMTAVTTILGLVPMAFGTAMGTSMVRPMAIVTIGGLIYGTLLTLYVVPCMYSLLSRKKDMTEKEI